jgi:hypothetical protein
MFRIILLVFLIIPFSGLPPLTFTYAKDSKSAEAGLLAGKYSEIQAGGRNRLSPLPLYLDSSDENNTVTADIYGVFNHTFGSVRKSLSSPGNWCDIVPLHLNIKACTFKEGKGRSVVTFYSGRKFYQLPEDAFLLSYSFSVEVDKPDYLLIHLSADEGPLGTMDHRIVLEVSPIDNARTLLHFSYSNRYSVTTEIAMKSYFATLGRGKIGFSISGKDKDGKPVYIDGLRGAIERNSVRYYFAVQSYIDTLKVPENERFMRRLNRWFDLTEQFPVQLFEMDRGAYLQSKLSERLNQERLQAALSGEAIKKQGGPGE